MDKIYDMGIDEEGNKTGFKGLFIVDEVNQSITILLEGKKRIENNFLFYDNKNKKLIIHKEIKGVDLDYF